MYGASSGYMKEVGLFNTYTLTSCVWGNAKQNLNTIASYSLFNKNKQNTSSHKRDSLLRFF